MQYKHLHIMISKDLESNINNFCSKHNVTKSYFIKSILLYFFKENNYNKIMFKDNNFKNKIIYEIHRYGNNINQIAHKLNIALKNEELTASNKIDIQSAIDSMKAQTKLIQEIKNLLGSCL